MQKTSPSSQSKNGIKICLERERESSVRQCLYISVHYLEKTGIRVECRCPFQYLLQTPVINNVFRRAWKENDDMLTS